MAGSVDARSTRAVEQPHRAFPGCGRHVGVAVDHVGLDVQEILDGVESREAVLPKREANGMLHPAGHPVDCLW